ncbi:MAG TPA: lipocalin-like domain-containing protein, partial [Terriglobales bacterium]
QTEWWYYTGNLRAADGHRFGFELTFFRQGINRENDSLTWGVNDLYMAHLALSDLSGAKFYHTERFNREGPGLAGVSERDKTVWNGNWQVRIGEHEQELQAVSDSFELRLKMTTRKPPVIHGRDGVSQKTAGAGHASHYISFTRLLTSGAIELKGAKYKVEGTSWMDHEFFTESLGAELTGWDWLSLQLADNTELMLYRLRRKDGSVDPYSSATYVDAQGHSHYLSSREFTMKPSGAQWTSTASRANYPVQWHVSIPSLGLELEITTPLHSQELASRDRNLPTYWEGAIDIAGTRSGKQVSGVGYLEMTGYDRNFRM